uniref:Capsid protein n=1 Tax=Dulem virus 176 TaxID=3145653 RepID=A0AAU8B6Z4_9VIRU
MKKPVSNLIKQNCFLRDIVQFRGETDSPVNPEKFVSVDTITTDSGVEVQASVLDFPITKESVNSYADAVNYRTSPEARFVPHGANLGDISAFQRLSASGDLSGLRSELVALKSRMEQLSARLKDKQSNSSASASVSDNGGASNG